MRKQTVNVLDNWVHISFQTKWAEDEKKDLELIINNEIIPYLYVNYIYQKKNQKCSVCGVDDGHCEHLYFMMYKGLHPKDWA